MNLENNINDEIKKAMLNKDESALRGLRAIKSAIILFKTSGEYKGAIEDGDEVKILQKLIKQRKDSIEFYKVQNRQELLQKEVDEITIIEKFLPQQINITELTVIITQIKNDNNITSINEMGKLIGLVNKKVAGQADGKTISEIVKKILA